jgi:hypothetical protein
MERNAIWVGVAVFEESGHSLSLTPERPEQLFEVLTNPAVREEDSDLLK